MSQNQIKLDLPNGKFILFDADEYSLHTSGAAMLQMPSGDFAPANGSPYPNTRRGGVPSNGPNITVVRAAAMGSPKSPASITLVSKAGFDFDPEMNVGLASFFDCFGGGLGDLFKLLHSATELMDGLSASSITFRGVNGDWVRYSCDLSPMGICDLFSRHWNKARAARASGLTPTQRATAKPSDLYGMTR